LPTSALHKSVEDSLQRLKRAAEGKLQQAETGRQEKRIRPARVDLWVLGLCPVVWVIAVGAMIWTDLDLLKKVPLINRLNWVRVIGNTAVRPINRTPSFHEEYVQQARAADTVDILWVGDSNTSN
jgi:hypothetical protein